MLFGKGAPASYADYSAPVWAWTQIGSEGPALVMVTAAHMQTCSDPASQEAQRDEALGHSALGAAWCGGSSCHVHPPQLHMG